MRSGGHLVTAEQLSAQSPRLTRDTPALLKVASQRIRYSAVISDDAVPVPTSRYRYCTRQTKLLLDILVVYYIDLYSRCGLTTATTGSFVPVPTIVAS